EQAPLWWWPAAHPRPRLRRCQDDQETVAAEKPAAALPAVVVGKDRKKRKVSTGKKAVTRATVPTPATALALPPEQVPERQQGDGKERPQGQQGDDASGTHYCS